MRIEVNGQDLNMDCKEVRTSLLFCFFCHEAFIPTEKSRDTLTDTFQACVILCPRQWQGQKSLSGWTLVK